MNNLKKVISIVTCVSMILAMSVSVFADENEANNQNEIVVTSNETETTPQPETDAVTESEEPTQTTEPVADTEPEPTEAPVVTTPESQPVEELTVPTTDNSEIKVTVNGVGIVFDDSDGKPQIINERTVVPFRKVLEAMNAAVAWRATDSTAHCFRNGISVMLTEGKPSMSVREYTFDEKFVYSTEADPNRTVIDPERPEVTPIRTAEDRLLVPIRATAEALGATVGWEDATNTVIITVPAYSLKLADKDAANLIANWNYQPATELKTGTVEVKVYGNFEGANASLGDGVVVTLDGKTQTAANGGVCSFADVKAGQYKITVSNVPNGCEAKEETVVVEAGKTVNVTIGLTKSVEEVKPDDEKQENTPADKTEENSDNKVDDKSNSKTETEK